MADPNPGRTLIIGDIQGYAVAMRTLLYGVQPHKPKIWLLPLGIILTGGLKVISCLNFSSPCINRVFSFHYVETIKIHQN
jgi:hypothetical protein